MTSLKNIRNSLLCGAAVAVFALAASSAGATTISIYDPTGTSEPTLTTYFTGQGYSVNSLTYAFGSLAGTDLAIFAPPVGLAQVSIDAISAYLNGGGRVILNSDHGDILGLQSQGAFNALMPQIGGTMLNFNGNLDTGPHNTTDIAVNSLTQGVASVNYDFTSYIQGGTTLVTGDAGYSIVNYEKVGAGYLFGIADFDVASAANFTGDNPTLYCNFGALSCASGAGGTGGAGGVPEPASWALMLVGIGAMGGALRRRQARQAIRQAA